MWRRFSSRRSGWGRARKNSQWLRLWVRKGRWGSMLRALRWGACRSRAGHTSTHRRQPVQSSPATWMVKLCPCQWRSRAGAERKPSGALARAAGSTTVARITAWGHTITHLPHCTHRSGSHTGIASAMLRFSHWAVPLAKLPSQGRALTGRASARRCSWGSTSSRTTAGAVARWAGQGSGSGAMAPRSATPGVGVISRRPPRAASIAPRLRATIASPLWP